MSQDQAEFLHIERVGEVAFVMLDRPRRRNAFTRDMWRAVPEIVAGINAEPDVRLAVLASTTPGIFSAGADLVELREHALDRAWSEAGLRAVAEAMDAVARLSPPTLALIDGPCLGGAVGLAVSCDMRIATRRSSFAVTAVRLGSVYPFTGTVSMVDLVGASNAKRILLTGGTFDAETAAAMGLVDRVVGEAELDGAVDALVEALVATSRTSVRLMKHAIQLATSGQRSSDAVTESFEREALRSEEYHEGISAFLERRSPAFD